MGTRILYALTKQKEERLFAHRICSKTVLPFYTNREGICPRMEMPIRVSIKAKDNGSITF